MFECGMNWRAWLYAFKIKFSPPPPTLNQVYPVSVKHLRGYKQWLTHNRVLNYFFSSSIDVNECATNNGGCQQICVNRRGTPNTCTCKRGFIKHRYDSTKCIGKRCATNLKLFNSAIWIKNTKSMIKIFFSQILTNVKWATQLCALVLMVRMENVELSALTHMAVFLVLVLMDIDYLAKPSV